MGFECIKNKIREQKGASLAMALFLLIVVIAVSMLILNSALSNIGRTRRNISMEQEYLTESSAVELVRQCLAGIEISDTRTETQTKTGTGTDETTTVETRWNLEYKDELPVVSGNKTENPFKELLSEWVRLNAEGSPMPKTHEFEIKAEGMDAVMLKLELGRIDFGEHSPTVIKASFALQKEADGSVKPENYNISMNIPCTVMLTSTSSGEDEDDTKITTTVYGLSTPSVKGTGNGIEIMKNN